MKKIPVTLLLTIVAWGFSLALRAETAAAGAGAAPTNSVPFEEIEKLIRQHLADATDQELNDLAVKGLIDQLKPHVALGHQSQPEENTNAPVSRVERYRKDFGYVKVDVVREGLRKALREAIDKLLADGPLKGLVVDLRFAGGTDYPAAAAAAGLFTTSESPLFRIGEMAQTPEHSDDPVLIPVMALTNGSTSGAGEALAAALREVKAGLLIGGRTAGEAMMFEEFPLSNGQVIRIASKSVQLADGKSIPRTGLIPDIPVTTTADEDRHYLQDPYWTGDGTPNTQVTLPHRRITEADLVRQRREGLPLQEIVSNSVESASSSSHPVRDPVLGRALDMLKALSVVQTWNHEK